MAPARPKHYEVGGVVGGGWCGGECEGADERVSVKVRGERRRALFRWRKAIVEPMFDQLKEARGFRRWLRKIGGERRIMCLAHNLLKR